MLIPELPEYLTNLGGGEYKGLIIALFTLTALISRPFSGKLADRIGRVPVMMAGSLVCFICSLIYPILTSISGFFLLRLVHGFSTGFTPTGQTAYLSDIIPAHRRGEAMGLLGTAGTLGMAGGPSVSDTLTRNFGLNGVFYCSSILAILSVVILFGIKETVSDKHAFHYRILKVKKADLFEPRVWKPCIVMVLCAFAYGTVYTIIPDFGKFVGVKDKGLLFTYLTVSILFVRLIGGKASDRWGRQPVLIISTLLITSSMFTIGLATSSLQLIIGIILYGLGHGATSPTLLAWATDLSAEHHKGKGVASLYMFMELGIGLGALLSGFIYSNNSANFFITFLICSVLSVSALVYLIFSRKSVQSIA